MKSSVSPSAQQTLGLVAGQQTPGPVGVTYILVGACGAARDEGLRVF